MSVQTLASQFRARAEEIGKPIDEHTAVSRANDWMMVNVFRQPGRSIEEVALPGHARDALRRLLPYFSPKTPRQRIRIRAIRDMVDAADRAIAALPVRYGLRIPSEKPVGNSRGFQSKLGWKQVAARERGPRD